MDSLLSVSSQALHIGKPGTTSCTAAVLGYFIVKRHLGTVTYRCLNVVSVHQWSIMTSAGLCILQDVEMVRLVVSLLWEKNTAELDGVATTRPLPFDIIFD